MRAVKPNGARRDAHRQVGYDVAMPNASRVITAQDLYNYTKCAHRVYLDAHGDPASRARASAFVRLLWEMGLQTEREYVRALGDIEYENLQALPASKPARVRPSSSMPVWT